MPTPVSASPHRIPEPVPPGNWRWLEIAWRMVSARFKAEKTRVFVEEQLEPVIENPDRQCYPSQTIFSRSGKDNGQFNNISVWRSYASDCIAVQPGDSFFAEVTHPRKGGPSTFELRAHPGYIRAFWGVPGMRYHVEIITLPEDKVEQCKQMGERIKQHFPTTAIDDRRARSSIETQLAFFQSVLCASPTEDAVRRAIQAAGNTVIPHRPNGVVAQYK